MDFCDNENNALTLEEIEKIVQTVYQSTRRRLEDRRKEKILRNLRITEKKQNASPVPESILRSVFLALDAISNISSCEATMAKADSPPNGLAWVRVSTNLKAPDNYKDKFFVPYLGESDAQQNFSNAVAADADEGPSEQFPEDDISDIENTIRVTPVEVTEPSPGKQNRTHKRKLSRNGDLRGSFPGRSGKGSARKSSESVWNRAARRVALERLIKKFRLKDVRSSAEVLKKVLGMSSLGEVESCYKNIAYRLRAYKDCDEEASLRHSQKKELLAQLSGSVRTQPAHALMGDSIPFFFCRQCYIYNCLEHGTQTAKPAKHPPDRTKKDGATRQGAEDIESRCPDRDICQCWCLSQSSGNAAEWWREMQRNSERSNNVKSVVLELFTSFGKDPCRISELGRLFIADHAANRLTCDRVGYLLETLEETNVEDNHCRQTARRTRKKYRTKAPRGETESMKGGQRVDYAPCQHDGPCTAKTCRCVENGVNCEKFCSCNHNRVYSARPDRRLPCPHAFQGCTCKSAVACISNSCVCYSYGRECDPDLCRACFDCKDNDGARSCRNVGLRFGERQRTVVGRSDTHGWGAFAANDIAKGDIIGEYVGEVVSHTEADRRGRLYDEIDYSFLFNITEDWALDSTRLGNKLRYCNHHFKPNCNAKLMRVGGDVRVGLYAVRDIGKHEELFFDYKYKNGPAWSMPGSKGKSHSRPHKQEASAKKRALAIDDDYGDDEVIPVPKKRIQPERGAAPNRDANTFSTRNGMVHGITATEEKLKTAVPETTGRRAFKQEKESADPRTNSILATKDFDAANNSRALPSRFENGLAHERHQSLDKHSNDEHESQQSPTLRDVFGSDLESLDENVNQETENQSTRSPEERDRSQELHKDMPTSARQSSSSVQLPPESSSRSDEDMFVKRRSPSVPVLANRTITQGEKGVAKQQSRGKDIFQNFPHLGSNANLRKEPERGNKDDRASRQNKYQSRRSASAVPHINLVSDDENGSE